MDPTPLLIGVLGTLATTIVTEASKDYLKDRVKDTFSWLKTLREGDKLEASYEDAMSEALTLCLEMLLTNIKANGYSDEELKAYEASIKKFVQDDRLIEELMNAIREPTRNDLPSADVLRERWAALGCEALPSDAIWNAVVVAFRRQSTKRMILSDNLREILNAGNFQALKELIERQGGVKVPVRRDKYAQRMRSKFSPVDLANLMPSSAEEPGSMVIRDVFVPQHVRENPPPLEIPKDFAERIGKGTEKDEERDAEQLEKLYRHYMNQSPKPVLDVIASPNTRLLVLTGEPGSGKSTLMRYLLTGVIEPPVNASTNQPVPWTLPFKDAFPLLIELRDFYAMRKSDQCDSFLEYVRYMGKTEQWFLDDHATNEFLESGPSLVMFDGLDEIFDAADRERVMQEIAGFALRYEHAKIIVTSRPLGYKDKILRDAGFAHFGIQDLDDKQVNEFIKGWFALTFPQQPELAHQRIQRVRDSIKKSKPIRMLAGNPMLLTIMALLAREEELPRERSKFYEKAVEVLCHHWDVNRHLELPEERYLRAYDKKVLLQRIALRMQTGKGGLQGNIIEETTLIQEIQSYLLDESFQPNPAEAKKAAQRIIEQLHKRNYILCLRGAGFYGFVHRTFLEYLTAAEYVHRFHYQPQQMTQTELIALFDQHCREDEWQEVLRLICSQIDEKITAEIIEHLATRTDFEKWDGKTKSTELPLAVWCLGEVKNMAKLGQTGDILLARLIEFFHSQQSTRIYDFSFFSLLINAVNELNGNWPGQRNIPNLAQLPSNGAGRYFWPQFVVAVLKGDREIVEKLVTTAEVSDFRRAAISTLAKQWPDESTRALLTEHVMQDQAGNARGTALGALARQWPDESTRTLLTERAIQDQDENTRTAAIEALVQYWPDESTRTLLTERAMQDQHEDTRRAALQALANQWPDESTRTLLTERAMQDQHEDTRRVAIQALAQQWPDESTRTLLTERAMQDQHEYTREAALRALANQWPDETTHTLLTERAMQDQHEDTRRAALQALANQWPDESTRTLLTERAMQDQHEDTRSTALEALAEHWPDEENTHTLLTQQIKRNGFAATWLAIQHSALGKIVFTRDSDGVAPYLDPTAPIPREHIERAAKAADISPEKIDETVASLSAFMGWDITQGSGAKRPQDEQAA